MVEMAGPAKGSRRRTSTSEREERELLADQVYLALKEEVLDNVVVPGSRLNIDALADRLGVSPTPIREALARLAAEKLIDVESYRGYFIKERPTPAQLADLFDVRKLLELHAVRRAATRPTMSHLVEMERLLFEMGGPDLGPQFHEFREFSILDQRFHETLVRMADSPALLDSWRALNIHVQASRFFRTSGLVDVQHSVTEHAAILGALVAGDTTAASEAVSEHVDAGLRRSLSGDPTAIGRPASALATTREHGTDAET
jgi:DNA-binding GntR family transcriptional regulator